MLTADVLLLAQILWDYHRLNHVLAKADCILALGSQDTRVAERAADLFLQGLAPLLIFSGGAGRLTKGRWHESEASLFSRIAAARGVPPEAILAESESTNTGENILFTRRLLAQKNLNPTSFVLVQKPYMERRTYATFQKQWPGKKLCVTSPQIAFNEYPTPAMPVENLINMMVGDLQRIRVYAEKGFQVHQAIPVDVWKAYESLVSLGFDKQLLNVYR